MWSRKLLQQCRAQNHPILILAYYVYNERFYTTSTNIKEENVVSNFFLPQQLTAVPLRTLMTSTE